MFTRKKRSTLSEVIDIHPLVEYQLTSNSTPLIEAYRNYTKKYLRMFTKDVIDFEDYDSRDFLCCYMPDKEDVIALRRGKYHSRETKAKAYSVLHRLQKAFIYHDREEVQHELIIPFLVIAGRFKGNPEEFSRYVYGAYRYELKRHIDEVMKNVRDIPDIYYFDSPYEKNIEDKRDSTIVMDDDLSLNDPNWLTGKTAGAPFDSLTREERLIMAKYYFETIDGKRVNTDKKIGQLLGKNPKSIHRIRNRVKEKLRKQIESGEIKWMKLMD